MCYSARSSLNSFVVGVIGSVALFTFEPSLAVFFAFVSLMQLYDFFFWTTAPESSTNHAFTKLAMVSNHLQPLVLAVATYFFKGGLHPLSIALTVMYSIAAVVYTSKHWTSVTHTTVTEQSKPGLHWQWNDRAGGAVLYTLFLAAFTAIFLQHYPFPLNVALVLITHATFATAWYKYKGRYAVGRFWCYFAAFVPATLAVSYLLVSSTAP